MAVPASARGYEHFPGTIGRTTSESTRAWPRERRAPEGAPNIVVVLMDDMGYSDIGPFGSEIDTPTLDRLAENGLRLSNYHSTPVCSPARAALLTGINPHRAGFASVANYDPGFPGLRLELDEDVLTLPEILRANGYATFAIGKWHLTRDALMNQAASRHTWPVQRGFDQYYGVLDGANSFFFPNQIVQDNTPLWPEELPEDYYLTDDYTDHAIEMIQGLRASDSRKPFFLYFAHTAMHGPLAAKRLDLEKYRGRYADGWDAIRVARHAKQIAEGLFPPGTPLPDRTAGPGFEVPAWDELEPESRELYERYMEVYAAMVDNVDQNLGRLLGTIESFGELDNTIVVFTSDNGGSAEGGPEGTRSYFSRFVHVPGLPDTWQPDVERDIDDVGTARTMAHYPRGWGNVSNTPFRYYKGQTFAGGVRVPFVLSWPAGLRPAEGDSGVRTQYQYVTDLLPTLLELAGLESPGVRHNLPAQEIDGSAFATVLRDNAPSTHREQYAEFGGSRGFYRDGWKIVTLHRPGTPFDDAEWQLYNVEEDPTESHDVAAEHPELVAELAAAWEQAAWHNTVFPLIDRGGENGIRRPAEREFERPVRLLPGTPRLERYRSSQLISMRSFRVIAEIDHGDQDSGVLVSHGDQGGGYLLFIEDGRLRLSYNEYGRMIEVDGGELGAGTHRVVVDFHWLPEFRWRIELSLDGVVVGSIAQATMLIGMAPFSGIDVGVGRGGPVSWRVHERYGSFRYRGRLHAVTYEPGEHADYDPALVFEAQRDAALFFD
ncbi:MAG: arylsulfatase [Microbacteriaceae bacterium]